MQELQKRLLGLLKEIDAICGKHGIRYYCSGGTVIGAVRHEGFIPWDDDIDVCMMREDFERFREVMRTDAPEGRHLLCSEDCPDYHSTIPRYAEDCSTSFCRYHLLGHVPAGVSIDIFILEPVPSGAEAQRDFIRRFFNYSDLVMPFYCFSHRVPEDHLDDIGAYLKACGERGEAAVIGELHEELFGRDFGDGATSDHGAKDGQGAAPGREFDKTVISARDVADANMAGHVSENDELSAPGSDENDLSVCAAWKEELSARDVADARSTGRGSDEKGLSTRGDADSEYVCLLWASSPSIFPRSIFGDAARLKFEDAEICVPQDWYRYLVLEYGMNWANVPYSEVHDTHITINRLDEPYEHCYEVRDSLYTQDELRELFAARKLAAVEYEKRHRRLLDARCRIKADSVLAALANRLEADGADLQSLFDAGDTDRVLAYFEPFLEIQLSRWFIGSRTRFHYYRYMYPVVIPLPDDRLDILLRSLLRRKRYSDVKKLLDAYERAEISSDAAAYAGNALAYVQKAEALFYYGDTAACIEACIPDAYAGYDEISGYMDELKCMCEASSDPVAVISLLEADSPRKGLLYEKALGDAYFNTGEMRKASAIYRHILDTSRNGMFWKDIRRRTGMLTDAADKSSPFMPGRLAKLENMLLSELAGICSENGIAYVISPEAAESLASYGRLGFGPARKIVYMTIENARTLMSVCGKKLPQGRCLRSWRDDGGIQDLILEYSIADSVYVNLRDIAGTISRGIGITVRIIRRGGRYAPSDICTRLMEQRGNHDFSIKHGSSRGKGQYFYYLYKPGSRPVRKLVSDDLIDKTALLSIGGVDYSVPQSVLECGNKKAGTVPSPKASLPENIFYSEYISAAKFMEISRRSGIDAVNMADYDRCAKQSRAMDAGVDEVWESIVAREQERAQSRPE